MKSLSVVLLLFLGLGLARTAEEKNTKASEITKLEVVDLGELSAESGLKIPESQRKRDSGYSYNRPDRFSTGPRFNDPRFVSNQSGYRGRIVTRFPSQINRPFNTYGPPNQNSPVSNPSVQYHKQELQIINHHKQFSNALGNQNSALQNQEVPSPIRNSDFVEPSPIASQNNEPFGQNTANYLPPRNQKLPAYSLPNTFAPGQQAFQNQNSQNQHQSVNFSPAQQIFQNQNQQIIHPSPVYQAQSQDISASTGYQGFQGQNFQSQTQNIDFQNQNFVQNQDSAISDAAQFLAQNAQVLSQLYGAPDSEQNFAPHNEGFSGQNNQLQGQNGFSSNQFQGGSFQNSGSSNQEFHGPLPSYASGTLSDQESLEKIQSQEKDRLIVQLQALLSQSQSKNSENSQFSEQYAQNHGNYIQNQNLLASISAQYPPAQEPQKFNQPNNQNNQLLPSGALGPPNVAFGQSPFVPGSTSNPMFSLGYGSTTTQSPSTTTTTTTTISPVPTTQNPVADGSSQSGTSLSVPSHSFPTYGGFVPTLVGGTNFIGNVPNYGTSFLGTGTVANPVQPAGSSPTHFGIPIPQDTTGQQGSSGTGSASVNPVSSPGHHFQPAGSPSPAAPVQPIGASSVSHVHPITFPLQPIQPINPIGTPLHSAVIPTHPVLPASPAVTPLHPVSTPVQSAHPIYGAQPVVYNPLLYKPVKAVYPVFYYPNLPYQLQKPQLPTYPWSYAPSYPQAKPAQNWK